jgi:hypothetical protein
MHQKKRVIFESDVDVQSEYCHNLVTQTKLNESQSKEYSLSDAMLMARLIYDLNTKIVREGASFAQQYLLNKGLEILGQKGQDASNKEIASMELLYSNVDHRNDSNIIEKSACADVLLRRKARRNHQGKNGLQWKANKRMAI